MSDIAPEQESSAERLDRRSIGGSLLLHAGLIAALLGLWRLDPPPEVPLPLIKVVLDGPGAAGAAGGGAGEAQGSPKSGPQPDAAPESAAAEAPPPETAAATPPEPIPAPAAAATPQPPPRPARKPAHVARTPAEPKVAAAPPAVKPTPAPSPTPARSASADPAPGTGGGPGGAAGRGQGVEGMGRGAVGNGPDDGPGDDYLEALRRWLARYKRYPDDAIRKQEEGRVEIGFVLDRDGTVRDAWIERSSGVPELDEAALAMMHRASPVPPLPPRYTGAQLKLDMPVDYSIGFFEKLLR